MTEGVDYSRTPNDNWHLLAQTLKASGKHFAGRYAVGDHSPGGRGITAAEYQALRANDIDVFLYWQTTTNWMLGGFDAGFRGAVNAEQNRQAAGIPPVPIYFACDFDATPDQQKYIDDCLRGAASVIGPNRVGLYAGYWPLSRAKANGTAKWFCQTVAWSLDENNNVLLMEGVHLFQYDTYGNFIGGVDVDLVRSYQTNFGQASKFDGTSNPDPIPVPESVKPTINWDPNDPAQNTGIHPFKDTEVLRMRVKVQVPHGTKPRWTASSRSKSYGKPIPPEGEITIVGTLPNNWGIIELPDGSYPRVALRRIHGNLPLPADLKLP